MNRKMKTMTAYYGDLVEQVEDEYGHGYHCECLPGHVLRDASDSTDNTCVATPSPTAVPTVVPTWLEANRLWPPVHQQQFGPVP